MDQESTDARLQVVQSSSQEPEATTSSSPLSPFLFSDQEEIQILETNDVKARQVLCLEEPKHFHHFGNLGADLESIVNAENTIQVSQQEAKRNYTKAKSSK